MKYLFLILPILLLSPVAGAQSIPYLRIAGNQATDWSPLIEKNVEFLDARVEQFIRGGKVYSRLRWFPDNGFITIIGDDQTAVELRKMGFEIIKSGVAESHRQPPAPLRSLPYQFGWPKTMAGWPGVYGQATTIADMNGDGKNEIFLNNIEGYDYFWRYHGTFVLSFPRNPTRRFIGINPSTGDSVFVSWISTGSRETAASGDIDGNGVRDVVVGKDIGYLLAFTYGPQSFPAFPIDLGLARFSNDPAVYDLDGDLKDEIVLMDYEDDFQFPNGPALLHIFNDDGSEMPGWPQQIPVECESSPVVGDIDFDGEPEIVVGSGKNQNLGIPGRIYAFNLNGTVCSGFPIDVGYAVESTPSLADIDLNGIVDILIRVKMETTGINGIYAFNGQGQLLSGFPAVIAKGGSRGAPAVADMDGDALPEIAYGTVLAVDSGMVYVWNYDGSLKAGFPQLVYRTWVEESVSLADVSGDGLPDVVATTNGVTNDPGMVWAFDYTGATVAGFPITTDPVIGSSLESAPSVADVDGDGDTELFTANWNGKVYAWDTPGQVTPDNQWPMYKYDANRTGNHKLNLTSLGEPAQFVPVSVELFQNHPNPFNPETAVRYRLNRSSQVRLIIYNLLGQVVRILVDERQPAGLQEIIWDGTDQSGQKVASGLYFYRLVSNDKILTRKMVLMR